MKSDRNTRWPGVCAWIGLMALPLWASAQTLTVGVRGGPESMDPHYSALGVHADAMKHIYDTLVGVDENVQLEPSLAESWRPIDETTWEFKLRQGVKFHDGSDFDAEDVKFSIERIPEVTGPTTMTIYVRRVAETVIVDPYTVHIKTDGPAATLPYDFVRLFIVSAEAAKDFSTKDTATEGFNSGQAAIGTGPFRFESWEPKGDLVLQHNDNYWRGAVPWETVVRKEMANDSSRLAALKAGQVDLINYVSAADWLALQRDADVDVFKADSVYIMNLQLDQREQTPGVFGTDGEPLAENPLRDLRVRKAFDHAIDRNTMVEVVLEGLGTPANQLMPKGFFGYSEKIEMPAYDPALAKQLLAEAGHPDGLKVDLYCTNDRLPGDGAICQGLGQMFAKVGIDTNVNAISRTVYFPAQAERKYSVFMNGWGTLTGEASYTVGALAHSPAPELKLGAFNRTDYANPEVDKAMQAGVIESDDTKRRAHFERAMEVAMEDRALIPIINLQSVWAASKGKLKFTPRSDEETLAFFIEPAQ